MKKCPTCEKTFDDSMKFCQVDGSLLVDDAPAFDPYATMVGQPRDVAAPEEPPKPPAFEPEAEEPAPIAPPDNILDLPEADPLKTMYVSESELKEAMGGTDSPAESPVPEPPVFAVPDVAPPPSPFSAPPPAPEEPVAAPPFEEAPPAMAPSSFEPASPVAEWTPPPAPEAAWQNKEIGANTPFQPPATGSINQTLPIVSLILGIISICCYISPLTGLIAVVTGFLGMKNANNDPQHYGGKGLAIAGMIMGGLFFLIGTAYYIIVILMYAGIIAGSVLQGY